MAFVEESQALWNAELTGSAILILQLWKGQCLQAAVSDLVSVHDLFGAFHASHLARTELHAGMHSAHSANNAERQERKDGFWLPSCQQ